MDRRQYSRNGLIKMLFDYSISNPPYQRKIGVRRTGQVNYSKCYDLFQQYSYYYSTKTIMIYPAGWLTSTNYSYTKWVFNQELKSLYYYNSNEVFGDSIIKDYPLIVIQLDHNYEDSIVDTQETSFNKNHNKWLDTKKKNIVFIHTKNYPYKLNNGATWIGGLNNIQDSDLTFYPDDNDLEEPIKIFIKRYPGTGDNCQWFYLERKEILEKYDKEDVDNYTVAIPRQYFSQNRMWIKVMNNPELSFKARIFPPKTVFAKTYLKIINFETRKEAENFCKYLNSYPITILASIEKGTKNFGINIPLLEDYKNNSIINWDSENIDNEICSFFNIKKEDIYD